MFGIGWPEFLLILGVAIVVIGPEDIPHALYSIGKVIKKFKKLSSEIQKSVEVVMLEGELNEITQEANKAGEDTIEEEFAKQRLVEDERKAVND